MSFNAMHGVEASLPNLRNPSLLSTVSRHRKRARRACMSCRSRKVRCDVSIRGRPCVNCYLDGENCVVVDRSRKPSQIQPNTTNSPMGSPTSNTLGIFSTGSADSPVQEGQTMLLDTLLPAQPTPPVHSEALNDESFRRVRSSPKKCDHGDAQNPPFANASPAYPQGDSVDHDRGNVTDSTSAPDVPFCHYPFLTINNIHNIQPDDFNFLELQGCLRIPTRDLLDDFIQQYFLHVHPILPLLNEGDFWDCYSEEVTSPPGKQISLLVFQSILFASCTFVSSTTTRRLGFSSERIMRASYYRRAKLLHDLGSESLPLSIAQASLLLSFTSLSAPRKPRGLWLNIAIENARIAEAHLYASIPISSILPEERKMLKRVWWCCILRDRSMGLLLRRPIRITKQDFNFTSSPFCITDLEDEFHRSRVYDSATKRKLTDITVQWTGLNIALTDIIMLIYPSDEQQDVGFSKFSANASKLLECKSALKRWYDIAIPHLSFPFEEIEPSSPGQLESDRNEYHPSVILYTYLMIMYYFTAHVMLSQFEILQRAIWQRLSHAESTLCQSLSAIVNSRQELKDAAACIAVCHYELVIRGLDRWLPISAIGCTAFPLMLHILDTKLADRKDCATGKSDLPSDEKDSQLHALVQVMKTYQKQYDGVDWVTEIFGHIISLCQIQESGLKGCGISWADILVFRPDSYLRLTLTLDMSLRKGRLAEDGDFPLRLRGLFTPHTNPFLGLVEPQGVPVSEENNDDTASAINPSVLLNYEGCLQEQNFLSLSPSSSHGNLVGALEAEVYLQLAGGATEQDPLSSSDIINLDN